MRALYEHNYTQLLGRTKSGTLVLSEDDIGLRFELTRRIPSLAMMCWSWWSADISGMSFGFRALKEAWDIGQSPYLRTVTAAELRKLPLPPCLLTLSPAWKSRTVRFSPNILNCAALAITAAAGLN